MSMAALECHQLKMPVRAAPEASVERRAHRDRRDSTWEQSRSDAGNNGQIISGRLNKLEEKRGAFPGFPMPVLRAYPIMGS
jgi:hypothetical protein